MKQRIKTLLLLLCLMPSLVSAQVSEQALIPFIGANKLISKSGDGLKQTSGDVLLECASDENDFETLILLRNTNGKLNKIAENSQLLMNKELLGVSGGNYPDLTGSLLSIDYTTGSNSAQSDVSIQFSKSGDGQYYFTQYTLVTRNYGVENLFARQRITAVQTGAISFTEASENLILEKAKIKAPAEDDRLYQASRRFAKEIPQGWNLATFAEGDLNLDDYKKDLLLVLYNEDACQVQLLLQQKNGGYLLAKTNKTLIIPNEDFNSNNLRAVIKNGFFTIERRVPVNDLDFEHQYFTFKYDPATQSWLLHRVDVETYSGFDPKPSPKVVHKTKKDFGTIDFTTTKNKKY